MHVAIAGNIGAGKTTLTKLLAKHYKWKPHYESVDENPYLDDFYTEMARWSFNLQVYFLNSRFRQIVALRKSGDNIIQDRTIYEDAHIFAPNLHAMGLMTNRDYSNYSSLFDLMENFPEKLSMAGSAQVNLYGDISFGNDYVDADYIPELELEIEIPFRMGLDGVVLEEVYTLDPLEFPQFDGRLLIDLTSTFPVEVIADVDYVVNDAIGTVVAVNTQLEAGISFPEMPDHALLIIPLNQAIVEPGGNVYVRLTVRTDGAQTFTGYENIRVQVRIEGTQLIEVE